MRTRVRMRSAISSAWMLAPLPAILFSLATGCGGGVAGSDQAVTPIEASQPSTDDEDQARRARQQQADDDWRRQLDEWQAQQQAQQDEWLRQQQQQQDEDYQRQQEQQQSDEQQRAFEEQQQQYIQELQTPVVEPSP